ncbi:MAG: ATPase [Solirubrobacteraceae bacterium]
MDSLELFEQLDELVREAKAVPLTDQVRLDRGEVGRILDDLRSAIVDESRQARSSPAGSDEALADAKREMEQLLEAGREQASAETSESQISRTAERQAEETLGRARRQAFEIQLEIEQWADGVLAMLEPNLENLRRAVHNGRERLLERSSNESAANGLSKRDPDPTDPAPR